jgi:hypothetical protein
LEASWWSEVGRWCSSSEVAKSWWSRRAPLWSSTHGPPRRGDQRGQQRSRRLTRAARRPPQRQPRAIDGVWKSPSASVPDRSHIDVIGLPDKLLERPGPRDPLRPPNGWSGFGRPTRRARRRTVSDPEVLRPTEAAQRLGVQTRREPAPWCFSSCCSKMLGARTRTPVTPVRPRPTNPPLVQLQVIRGVRRTPKPTRLASRAVPRT